MMNTKILDNFSKRRTSCWLMFDSYTVLKNLDIRRDTGDMSYELFFGL